MNKRWLLINENEDYVIKSKLTVTLKILSKYNDRRNNPGKYFRTLQYLSTDPIRHK